MSELIGSLPDKARDVYEITKGLIKGENGKCIYDKYKDVISKISALDVIVGFDLIVNDGFEMTDIKIAVSKALNLFYKSLIQYDLPIYSEDNILYYLAEDNDKLLEKINEFKKIVKKISKEGDISSVKNDLLDHIFNLENFDKHYIIKENILFPLIEKSFKYYGCLKIMWSIHDDIRNCLKNLKKVIESSHFDIKRFNSLIGKLFFDMHTLVFREKFILFPVCAKFIDETELQRCLIEALEIGFPLAKADIGKVNNIKQDFKMKNYNKDGGLIDLDTGLVSAEQIKLIFNNLPVDITFVDENDTVRYFSSPKDRIFVRTKAIIGRKVQNCHPHESVHIVNKIIDAFKKGEKDFARFWIQLKDKFILIQYFAIRDNKGNYKGLIEVSQDITDIRKLEGEQRLLDWENNE